MKSSSPFVSFVPSGQTERYLTPSFASAGLYSCLQATSQVLHPQQANSSTTSAYLFMASLLLFRAYSAKKRSDVRRAHRRVTTVQGIVCQDVDVGFVPS